MPAERSEILCLPLSAALLAWPAAWNRYPIVFADTGTYLSQAVHAYLGWDRPPFYSLFILPLHLTLTLWPVVAAQALLAAWVLHLLRRSLAPYVSCWWLIALCAGLAVTTWLPWLVSTVMPDLFTPLLVLAMGLLAWAPLRRWEAVALVTLATLLIAAQQSSVLLAAVLTGVIAARSLLRPASPLPVTAAPNPPSFTHPGIDRWHDPLTVTAEPDPLRRSTGLVLSLPRPVRPLVFAVGALLAVNLAGFGRLSLAPFGSVFLLARLIYDGPGMQVLQRDCPTAGWRLCPLLDRFPSTSDEFLWSADSPVIAAGGHKAIAGEANAIIRAALLAEPGTAMRAALANGWEQLGRFASGDGLGAWPEQVDRWIELDLLLDAATYHAASQQSGTLTLPDWLMGLHRVTIMLGIAAGLIWLAAEPHRDIRRDVIILTLVALPASALITGGLSTPHDRYQSRIAWLPACVTVCTLLGAGRPPAGRPT